MTVSMMLDLLLTGLLVAMIAYSVLLNRRLSALRRDREAFRALVADFTNASEKARAGMSEMRAASETTGKVLKDMMDDAQALRDDLSFLIERGGAMADRLEQDVRDVRVRTKPAAAPAPGGPSGATARNPAPAGAGDPLDKLRRILEATR